MLAENYHEGMDERRGVLLRCKYYPGLIMGHLLLLGAGFSRNWGGWLASEAFEYLLGVPTFDADLRALLWRHKPRGGFGGGFEAALAELQSAGSNNSSQNAQLNNFQNAVKQMFDDMNRGYESSGFEFQNQQEFMVSSFLCRFDAIFTLNQDLLLERHYLNDNVMLMSSGRWNGYEIPGMTPMASGGFGANNNLGEWRPTTTPFSINSRMQPYFKLHGSSNWLDSTSEGLLVMGGQKEAAINRFPILRWQNDQFRERISQPATKLMVIGYGFGDEHINSAIKVAAENHGLKIFIIDPAGVDVVDKNFNSPMQIYVPSDLASALRPTLIGSSRRSMKEIFSGDRVEHAKIMNFFHNNRN